MSSDTLNFGHHSWHDFTAKAAERVKPGAKVYGGSASQGGGGGDTSWHGATVSAAIKMAREGWQAGAADIAKALDLLPPELSALPDWQIDVAGAFPCVPAFLAGEPECVWQQTDNARTVRRINLVVPFNIPNGVEQSAMRRYAQAVAATVRAIEATGIDVAVTSLGLALTGSDRTRAVYSIGVREFGEPLDLAKVAFAFHPAMFRRIGFMWHEMNKDSAPHLGTGLYGFYPPELKPELSDIELLGHETATALILPTAYGRRMPETEALVHEFIELANTHLSNIGGQQT